MRCCREHFGEDSEVLSVLDGRETALSANASRMIRKSCPFLTGGNGLGRERFEGDSEDLFFLRDDSPVRERFEEDSEGSSF